MPPLLQLKDVSLSIGGADILRNVSFSLNPGQTLGLVGRSGSGKSMTALAIMGLAPRSSKTKGEILFHGENLLQKNDKALCKIRGRKIAMIFQEPMTALNPVQTIGAQVAETMHIHTDLSRAQAAQAAAKTLIRAGLSPDEAPPDRYPHELSGGQRQRVVIAIAIAMKPDIVIADEPTTALDVTTQKQIIDQLKTITRADGAALVFITHNLAVISTIADRIVVMDEGRIVKNEPVHVFFARHSAKSETKDGGETKDGAAYNPPAAIPISPPPKGGAKTLLKANAVVCDYPQQRVSMFTPGSRFRAVDHVSFELQAGENLGLVGASGCGKSTLARALLGLEPLSKGTITVDGETFPSPDPKTMRRIRRKIQIVFQDPYGSFNPRHRIGKIIAEPFHLYAEKPGEQEQHDIIVHALENVGLQAADRQKYPHQFSGGQRQRIAIARALITNPSIIILDEATSALDMQSRTRILELLSTLSAKRDLSYLFITHDLSVIRNITSRLLVMKDGAIIESGATADLFDAPRHPYTKSLIAAAPSIMAAAE